MVNHLNTAFAALADPTRRAILRRLVESDTLTIKELAEPFAMSLVAVSKHIQVLERAQLVTRNKSGRDNYLSANPLPLREVHDWLGFYEQYWNSRFDALDVALKQKPVQTLAKPGKKSVKKPVAPARKAGGPRGSKRKA